MTSVRSFFTAASQYVIKTCNIFVSFSKKPTGAKVLFMPLSACESLISVLLVVVSVASSNYKMAFWNISQVYPNEYQSL